MRGETGVRHEERMRDNSADDRRFIMDIAHVFILVMSFGEQNKFLRQPKSDTQKCFPTITFD